MKMKFKMCDIFVFSQNFLQFLKLELFHYILALLNKTFVSNPLIFVFDFTEDTPK